MNNLLNWLDNYGSLFIAEVDGLGKLDVACDSPEDAAIYFAENFFTSPQLEEGVVVEVDTDPYNVQLENGGLKAWKI